MYSTIQELQDFKGTIDELILQLTRLKETYGGNKIIEVDAGYNNVDFLVNLE